MSKKSKIFTITSLLILSISSTTLVNAAKFIDPTRPANYKAKGETTTSDTSAAAVSTDAEINRKPILKGIFFSNGQFKAFINKKSYKINDQVANYTLTAISKTSVTLISDTHEELVLSLNRTIRKAADPLTILDISQSGAIPALLNFQQNLKDCKISTVKINLGKNKKKQDYEQQILGWQNNKTCLVKHHFAQLSATCEYTQQDLNMATTDDKLQATEKILETINLMQNQGLKITSMSLKLPSYCKETTKS